MCNIRCRNLEEKLQGEVQFQAKQISMQPAHTGELFIQCVILQPFMTLALLILRNAIRVLTKQFGAFDIGEHWRIVHFVSF
jgi:hypothetical protein